ncbi:cilia- and flagella-associated protein 157 [Diorhabda sublineata]|uniref:cilia- and flagella-associated protein 157 n=1 Tax=Diorhabda sublineata TaxID=1163346 RepID=UPI0024E136C5|nr:cilia- and flagella-associated protein 157 [Diorhabda sublineata]
MAKGKKGKKGKKQVVVDPNALTEVDKTFYELTITDLNRKLARLRSLNQEIEQKNEELMQDKDKLDEDKTDIIMYLKRILQEKTDEIAELEDRIKAMKKEQHDTTQTYEEKIIEMTNEYNAMHDQLTSENKLLEGKLNSLEEFRSQRDELMKKFENQENLMEMQEKRHKREMYEIERKFIIGKDRLKKDMEAKLRQLSTEFHDATELRIAATTHRVIRENIAVNNELDVLLNNQQRLHNENVKLKNRDGSLRQQIELLEEEKKMALSKVRVQVKLIDRLTDDYQFITKQLNVARNFESQYAESKKQLKTLEEKLTKSEHAKRILEQNLHHVRCDRTSIQTDYLYMQEENERLNEILLEAVSCIKEALTVRTDSEISLRVSKKDNLLNSLLSLLNKGKEQKVRCPSLETVSLFEATYARGDLGFVPKPVELRSKVPVKKNMETQTGTSFDEYISTGYISKPKFMYSEVEDEESLIVDAEEESQGEAEQRESVLFFDEQEITGEESSEDDQLNIYDLVAEEQAAEEVNVTPSNQDAPPERLEPDENIQEEEVKENE